MPGATLSLWGCPLGPGQDASGKGSQLETPKSLLPLEIFAVKASQTGRHTCPWLVAVYALGRPEECGCRGKALKP